ncbi:MAG: S26 family signal peptidase [Acidobacteriota bacterium]|nr:S26 family signal peptidase [Acidobacteriota bacterium]MDH3522240.1 S26 family signal peptidase [Acidobacteriota bacterium]
MRIDARTAAILRDIAAHEPVSMIVAGGCMRPCLETGDRIRVRGGRIYWPGDVVAFHREDGRLLVHRVLGYFPGRRGWSIVAKGDGLSREDEPVARRAVIGRVVDHRGRPAAVGASRRCRSLLQLLRVALRRSLGPWRSATSS